MKRFLVAMALLAGLAFTAGAADDQPKGKGKFQGKSDVSSMFKKMDANGDGKVDLKEFKAFFESFGGGRLKDKPEIIEQIFQQLDANSKGYITEDDLKKLGEQLRQNIPDDLKQKIEDFKKNGGGEDFKKKLEELKKKAGSQ